MGEILEGYTLGERHRFHNKLVNEAIASNQTFEPTLIEDDDIRNLIKIDVAAANRNIDFILDVLKCEDVLYINRAIRRSTWLITEQKYAHKITVDYLSTELFPHMTTTAINMLLSSIRRHLKDETRVEGFYNYLKIRNRKPPFQWLCHCSTPFVENEVRKHISTMPDYILPRLFEKSLIILEAALKSCKDRKHKLEMAQFIKLTNIEQYLDIVENVKEKDRGLSISFTAKRSARIMKECPDRILNKFEMYYDVIDMPTFVKYLKNRKDKNEFLLKLVKNKKIQLSLKKILELLKLIIVENVDFINILSDPKHFLKFHNSKKNKDRGNGPIPQQFSSIEEELIFHFAQQGKLYNSHTLDGNQIWYRECSWYRYAPFKVACENLMKIEIPYYDVEKIRSILDTLLYSAGNNMENIRTAFKYCYDWKFEAYDECDYNREILNILNIFFSRIDLYSIDDETWDVLNRLFQKIENLIKTSSYEEIETCVHAILIRNVIRGQSVPDNVKFRFKFDTLASYKSRMVSTKHRDLLFTYLFNYLNKHIEHNELTTEMHLKECLTSVHQLLRLMKDWKRDIKQYPIILVKIKQLINLTIEYNLDQEDISLVFNLNKYVKKMFFKEYVELFPEDIVGMDVLRYDPGLLLENKKDLRYNRFKESKLCRKQHAKMFKNIRIYWSDSISKELKSYNLENLGDKEELIALIILLSRNELKTYVEKYNDVPAVIQWIYINDDAYQPSMYQKYIAESMYIARPLIHADFILPYAIGEFMQHARPSLTTVLYKLSANKAKEWVIKLLNGPVPWQTIGIRYALRRLDIESSKAVFSDFWGRSKNSSSQIFLFTRCHHLMCKETIEFHAKNTWEVISMFIDDLCTEEDTKIYEIFGEIENVPRCVKPQYFMKIYPILLTLPEQFNGGALISKMELHCLPIMHLMDKDFIVDVVVKNWVVKIKNDMLSKNDYKLFSSLILANKSEDVQVQRYSLFVAPLLDNCLSQWTTTYKDKFTVERNMQSLLKQLVLDMKEYTKKMQMNFPLIVFENIQSQLETKLSYQKNYIFLTYWKLAVEFMKLIDENKHLIRSSSVKEPSNGNVDWTNYVQLLKDIAPSFAKVCIRTLEEDVRRLGPSIETQFTLVLEDFSTNYSGWSISNDSLVPSEIALQYYQLILEYAKDSESCLMIGPIIQLIDEKLRKLNPLIDMVLDLSPCETDSDANA